MLSKAKNVMSHMHNAFYEWAWPKGVRWYRLDSQIRIPRYPAPASQPVQEFYEDANKQQHEYKMAYRDSKHNIRYEGAFMNVDRQELIHDALGESVEQKLIRLGYIQKKDGKIDLKLDEARQLYAQKTVLQIDDSRCKTDSIGITENPIEKNNRDSIAQFVRQQFQANKETNRQECVMNDIDEIYNQEFFIYTAWGIADNDPIYQQMLLDLEYHIEEFIKHEKKRGEIPFFVGDASYWNVLDNSHSPENILLTQKVVKDLVTDLGYQNNLRFEEDQI